MHICGFIFISAVVHQFFYHLYWSFSLHNVVRLLYRNTTRRWRPATFCRTVIQLLDLVVALFPNKGPEYTRVRMTSRGKFVILINVRNRRISLALCHTFVMDSFDNFQFDSASSYGGIGIVDDTSSVYTTDADASSQSSRVPTESLENLSLDDNASDRVLYTGVIEEKPPLPGRGPMEHAFDEDFDNVLDELPDDGQVELPPHACR